jgi:hypothetical protein
MPARESEAGPRWQLGTPIVTAATWLSVLAAVPLRLFFFAGYGLGDDHIFAHTPLRVLETGGLDFADFRTNRLLLVVPQVLAFLMLPVNDFSFVLPVLVYAFGTHAMSVLLVRDVMGARAALFTSLLFLASPFESLASTSFALDYGVAFYSVASAWSCQRGLRDGRAAPMVLAAALLVCAFLVKFSAVLLVPVAAVATLSSLRRGRRWREWLVFWGAFLAAIGLVSGAFALAAGDPLQWLRARAYPAFGHDVTNMLGRVFAQYPRYVLWKDPDYGVWMFGWTGLLGIAGMAAAAALGTARLGIPGTGLVLLGLFYALLFNFAPHKVDFARYYSHPRIFRYLAQVAPCIYVASAFALDALWRRSGLAARVVAAGALAVACGFGLAQMPSVTEPSRDPGADGRALSRFFRADPPRRAITIHGDEWNCARLADMNYPESRRWRFDCRSFVGSEEKRVFLEAIDHGYVVTGGGALAWYSLRPWVLNLTELGFVPGPDWELLMERPAPVKPWRIEPLRVWRVRDALERVVVDIPDARFEACLRARVSPLRPEDGLGRDQPITARLARHVTTIECLDAGIGEATGLDAFVNTTVLNLAGNALTAIDVGALTRLEVLVLGVNALERVTGLGRLESLRLLWLGRNRLEAVDVSGLRNLEDLRVDGNRLTSLRGLGDSGRLKTIFLGENPSLDCEALELPRDLLAQSGCQG